MLIIYPRNNNWTKVTDELNEFELTIDCIYGQETNTNLPLLDILLIIAFKNVFTVHHKSTYKNDHICIYIYLYFKKNNETGHIGL